LEDIKDFVKQQSTHYLYHRIGKRTADIIASSSLLLLCFPLFLIFAAVLFCFSGRPILFKQLRTGRNNKPFTIWKFRTMQLTVLESGIHQYEWESGVPQDFSFAKPSHQKVTRLGSFYRKYSIDEIPQLWNVLKGDMSIVGPRPEIIEITKHYSWDQKKRLLVKPGITGYAQVNGRSSITHGEKIVHDLYYVKNCSFSLDLKIVFRTLVIVVTGKGAY
jgi:lipopolysaccharide/colanic/teichoic acid biosynthesis glycosyltransferase